MDQPFTTAQKRENGHAQDLGRSAAQQHLLRLHMVRASNLFQQPSIFSERIAVRAAARRPYDLLHFWRGTVGIFIVVQADEAIIVLPGLGGFECGRSRSSHYWPVHPHSRASTRAQPPTKDPSPLRHINPI